MDLGVEGADAEVEVAAGVVIEALGGTEGEGGVEDEVERPTQWENVGEIIQGERGRLAHKTSTNNRQSKTGSINDLNASLYEGYLYKIIAAEEGHALGER